MVIIDQRFKKHIKLALELFTLMLRNISMQSLKKYLPVKTNDLIRVGRNRDGGYVMNERTIHLTKYLVGLGISTDWSFEKDFKQKNKSLEIFAFDFSVSYKDFINVSRESLKRIFKPKEFRSLKTKEEKIKFFFYPFFYFKVAVAFKSFFKASKKNTFFKKGLDKSAHDIFINTDDMFSLIFKNQLPQPDSVFLKIDIERAEYAILPDVLKYATYINGMVIEIHDLKNYWPVFENLMNDVMKDYDVVHIHGNNFAGYISGTQTPDCIEITIIKKKFIKPEELSAVNDNEYPLKGLDKPCKLNKPDIKISFE